MYEHNDGINLGLTELIDETLVFEVLSHTDDEEGDIIVVIEQIDEVEVEVELLTHDDVDVHDNDISDEIAHIVDDDEVEELVRSDVVLIVIIDETDESEYNLI